MSYTKYEKEQDLLPQYEITKELSDLKLMFIISSIIYFLVGGSLAIIMQIIQSKVILLLGNQQQSLRLFYAALTIHGQVIFLDLFRC
jgi:heme/copper-type cytochrome/quinol oxidase subunit 1